MERYITRPMFVQIGGPKVLMSTLLTRTQITLCLCKDLPFTNKRTVSRCVNATTDQGALVACYSCFGTTKAPVGTSKELTETTTRAFKESFQFVSFKIVE